MFLIGWFFFFTLVQQAKDNQMIVRHFIRVPLEVLLYCDNQPVKILEKGYALLYVMSMGNGYISPAMI